MSCFRESRAVSSPVVVTQNMLWHRRGWSFSRNLNSHDLLINNPEYCFIVWQSLHTSIFYFNSTDPSLLSPIITLYSVLSIRLPLYYKCSGVRSSIIIMVCIMESREHMLQEILFHVIPRQILLTYWDNKTDITSNSRYRSFISFQPYFNDQRKRKENDDKPLIGWAVSSVKQTVFLNKTGWRELSISGRNEMWSFVYERYPSISGRSEHWWPVSNTNNHVLIHPSSFIL